MKWQPIPLLGFAAEHEEIQGGEARWQVGINFNWSFDLDLSQQLNPDRGVSLKPLNQARKDFVQRDYNVILNYKEKEKPQSAPPVVDVTAINGELKVGATLTGVYSFDANAGEGTDASTMQWKNGGHVDADTEYLLAADDVGKTLTFEVTAKNGAGVTGNTDSMDIAAPVIDPAVPSTVVIIGDVGGYPQVGQALTASVSCEITCAPDLQFQWQLETGVGSADYADISGANSATYVPISTDQKRTIRVLVSRP